MNDRIGAMRFEFILACFVFLFDHGQAISTAQNYDSLDLFDQSVTWDIADPLISTSIQ